MSKIDYQALREAAEKATWGDWDSYKPHRGARGYEVRLSSQAIAQHVLKNNAEFIAAFNPKVALALLDEINALEETRINDVCRIAELTKQLESAKSKLNEHRKAYANTAASKDGWISCSERMPEKGERQCYVLAADFKNNYPPNIPNTQVGVYGDWFNDGKPTWDDGDGEDLYLKEVTHWTPLPEPPQEVK